MAAFLLVHGSWHGSWAWSRLRPVLAAMGHETFCPTLSGCAERFDVNNRSVRLETHINEVAGLLRYEDLSDVVLVGHSSAGMLLEGIASREFSRIAAMIYLDAYVVASGWSAYDVWTPEQVRRAQESERGGYPFRDPLPTDVLGIESAFLAQWVAERLTPHPLGCFSQTLPTEDPRAQLVPRHYIHCTAGPLAQLFDAHADAARARGWAVSELDAPHDSMLTDPEPLAAALIAAIVPISVGSQ